MLGPLDLAASLRVRVCLQAVLFLLLLSSVPAYAQGCAACRDTTAGSAPRAREGLRRAILVLGVPSAGIFVAVLFVAVRIEQRFDD
jgi:hypothetical protein